MQNVGQTIDNMVDTVPKAAAGPREYENEEERLKGEL